jgi:hypothetical protein
MSDTQPTKEPDGNFQFWHCVTIGGTGGATGTFTLVLLLDRGDPTSALIGGLLGFPIGAASGTLFGLISSQVFGWRHRSSWTVAVFIAGLLAALLLLRLCLIQSLAALGGIGMS